ncbi:hypothetical protein NFS00_14835 [Enterobacter hormaechei]|uniref:hypothetical protein n=1 Tax=Enterobacter hormaechei TaxID=158836 RepID=UPI002092D61D|nr:hypothetical protein [Enterobacter hormaechei]MCO6022299.1 hypothetical protein [Enterobacter hormaechei]
MSNIDKHAVQAVADLKAGYTLGHADVAILNELARIALASLEAEPVCVIDQSNLDYLKSGSDADVWPASRTEMGDVLLYRAAPPAPVSVPDERYQHLSELYHAQEKRLFKLAQRIKGPSFDKYAYSPSQAIDVLESAIFGEREDDCRAALLQGADGNSPAIPDGWTGSDEANAALIMLDRIETVDSVDDDRIEGIKRIIRALAAAPKQEVK